MQGHKNWVLCVAWSPDGQVLATGGMDGALWLWDPKTGNPLGCCKGARSYPARSHHSRKNIQSSSRDSSAPPMA